MSITVPLHNTKDLDRIVRHRQEMVNLRGGEGFRTNFMEISLVQLGLATPDLLKPDQSDRSKRKAEAMAEFRANFGAKKKGKNRG